MAYVYDRRFGYRDQGGHAPMGAAPRGIIIYGHAPQGDASRGIIIYGHPATGAAPRGIIIYGRDGSAQGIDDGSGRGIIIYGKKPDYYYHPAYGWFWYGGQQQVGFFGHIIKSGPRVKY